MNWTQYSKLLEVKIADTHYNMKFAEKKYKEAKAHYEASLREKHSFESALDDLMGKKSNGV